MMKILTLPAVAPLRRHRRDLVRALTSKSSMK